MQKSLRLLSALILSASSFLSISAQAAMAATTVYECDLTLKESLPVRSLKLKSQGQLDMTKPFPEGTIVSETPYNPEYLTNGSKIMTGSRGSGTPGGTFEYDALQYVSVEILNKKLTIEASCAAGRNNSSSKSCVAKSLEEGHERIAMYMLNSSSKDQTNKQDMIMVSVIMDYSGDDNTLTPVFMMNRGGMMVSHSGSNATASSTLPVGAPVDMRVSDGSRVIEGHAMNIDAHLSCVTK